MSDGVQEELPKFVRFAKRLDRLSREHKQLKKALKSLQNTASFYQAHFQKADQVMVAVKKGYAPTPRFKPEFLRDKRYLQTIRLLCKQAVYSKWNREKEPSTLLDIYLFVKKRIKELISTGEWDPKKWRPPGKRTVDRRTNEAADPRYWLNGVTPIIALKAGLYIPNSVLFDDKTRSELERLADEWKKE